MRRFADRLLAGEPLKAVSYDFGLNPTTGSEYARRAGLTLRWVRIQ